ncbi:MAG: hypothetical protein ACRDLB_04965 [Actinomycetota bacterium]
MSNLRSKASRWGALVALGCLFATLGAATSSASPYGDCDAEATTKGPELCSFKRTAAIRVSDTAGLGRFEMHGKVGAVLQRDEGTVALLDLSDPARPKTLGAYEDGIEDSFDGDLAFSADGQWLFYARQTHQFSKDGIHVLNVSDPKAPTLAHYQPSGGAYRIAYHKDAGGEWVVLLDATHGLVVYRFEPTTGQLVPAFVDPLPALKVGGPASAGLYLDRKDPKTKTPLLYVTTGRTGLQVYDFSDPMSPEVVGSWSEVGLAEVEVKATRRARTVYAATEYWFDAAIEPEVVVLNASELEDISEVRRIDFTSGPPAPDGSDRVQGMDLDGANLLIAHSGLGLIAATPEGVAEGVARLAGTRNEGAGVAGAPYAMDVEARRGYFYLTDAATGVLTVLRVPIRGLDLPYGRHPLG